MSTQVSRIFEFGPFRLNEAECQLFREGKQVPIPPKVFATLMLLIDNRGHLVGKDQLMSQLWPDSFVEEVSLNRSISTLRKALGDTTTAPLYVETVPKRGYRFIAPVIDATGGDELVVERWRSAEIITEEVEETVSPYSQSLDLSSATEGARIVVPAPAISVVPKPDTTTRRRLLFAAVALAALIAVASSYFWMNNRAGRVAASTPLKSIAVLPFKVVGAESGDEHIGLGIADVLITRLSNIRELNVRPTSAVMNFVGRDSAGAGRELKVDAVLEGTIYRAGDRVRVTARLLKVSDQSPLWAGQFEKPLQDELKVQDEISLQLVDALALSLSGTEKNALTKRYTESADAYHLYLKGRYQWNKRNYEGFAEAERLFRNAIEKDPNFALAHVGLVDILAMTDPHISMSIGPDEKLHSLKKALELDPDLAEAHATLALVRMFHYWDWRGAEAALKRSIELNPGYATAHQWYATLLGIQGRTDQAKAEMRRALEINPLSHNFLRDMGEAHYFAREYDRAEEYCHKALESYPDFIFAHQLLEHIYLQRGEYEKYLEQTIRTTRLTNATANQTAEDKENLERHFAGIRQSFKRIGIKGYIAETLFHVPASRPSYWSRARFYSLFGEKEKALDNLEEAYRQRVFMLAFVKADPVFDSLRAEPRFTELLKNMNLAE